MGVPNEKGALVATHSLRTVRYHNFSDGSLSPISFYSAFHFRYFRHSVYAGSPFNAATILQFWYYNLAVISAKGIFNIWREKGKKKYKMQVWWINWNTTSCGLYFVQIEVNYVRLERRNWVKNGRQNGARSRSIERRSFTRCPFEWRGKNWNIAVR